MRECAQQQWVRRGRDAQQLSRAGELKWLHREEQMQVQVPQKARERRYRRESQKEGTTDVASVPGF